MINRGELSKCPVTYFCSLHFIDYNDLHSIAVFDGRIVLQDCSGQSSPSSLPQSGSEEALHYNVLVTSRSLIPSLVKCLLFKLDSFFTPENVYSSWDVGKLKCFAWIKDRFPGPNVQSLLGHFAQHLEKTETHQVNGLVMKSLFSKLRAIFVSYFWLIFAVYFCIYCWLIFSVHLLNVFAVHLHNSLTLVH
ncbi:hypothetical protein V2J09_016563 [Rumex salicifolius]